MSSRNPYSRAERVADEIFHIISQALITELSDPRLKGMQITSVKVTSDLRTARVWFHLNDSGDDSHRQAFEGLKSARGYLKRLIGKGLVLKFMPEIEFFYDETMDIGERIDELLGGLKGEKTNG